MKRTIFRYGIALAVLLAFLKFIEYRFLVKDFSLEFYLGMVAFFFTGLGVWAGLRLANKKSQQPDPPVVPSLIAAPADLEASLGKWGISKREHEVLCLIAQGHSNQEIADQLFLSLNTVKSHSSNLFSKLDVKRRTQAIQKAKALGLLPEQPATFG